MYCPNPECPDRLSTGNPSEYRDEVTTCPVCGMALEAGSWEDLASSRAAGDRASMESGQEPQEHSVELMRTPHPAEAEIVAGALEQEGIQSWRRTVGPSGALLAGGSAVTSPGVEHVVYVPEATHYRAQAVAAEVQRAVPDLEDQAGGYEYEVEAVQEDEPAEPKLIGGVAAFIIRAVIIFFMILGFIAVFRRMF